MITTKYIAEKAGRDHRLVRFYVQKFGMGIKLDARRTILSAEEAQKLIDLFAQKDAKKEEKNKENI